MRMTKKQQAVYAGGPGQGTVGIEGKGGAPTAIELTTEFAAEPGYRLGGERSGNRRVHKS